MPVMPAELVKGDRVAWVIKSPSGKTSGVSALHRVFEDGKTYCLHPVPTPDRRLNLSIPISLETCSRCERLWGRAATFEEAVSGT